MTVRHGSSICPYAISFANSFLHSFLSAQSYIDMGSNLATCWYYWVKHCHRHRDVKGFLASKTALSNLSDTLLAWQLHPWLLLDCTAIKVSLLYNACCYVSGFCHSYSLQPSKHLGSICRLLGRAWTLNLETFWEKMCRTECGGWMGGGRMGDEEECQQWTLNDKNCSYFWGYKWLWLCVCDQKLKLLLEH